GVTCVVRWYNGWTDELWKTEVVAYGTTLPDPADPCLDGFEFVGWEGSWTNITEDRAIKAWYYRRYKVKFINSETGEVYDTQAIRSGGDAEYPSTPSMDGYSFDHWEGSRKYSGGYLNICSIYEKLTAYK
ncbi:MAG TPA: InlB B-repeat-containing protein, partial [Lachnospiraceae bacterium]|nr:InlB B-repeat-containing protein [Lachnospiraceae bacterium]